MPRPVLTRSRIVSAGITIVSELGLPSLSLKAVARRVHATAAGVQRQISATELTETVVAQIMESMPHVPAKTNWSGRLRLWGVETRDWLAEYPGLAAYLLERRWDTPVALDRLEEVVAVFDTTDLAPEQGVMTAMTIFWFVVGSADFDESARAATGGSPGPAAESQPERRPRLRGHIDRYSATATRAQFDFGLDLLIKGIERRFGEAPVVTITPPAPRRVRAADAGPNRVFHA
jgi:hypothetical protein